MKSREKASSIFRPFIRGVMLVCFIVALVNSLDKLISSDTNISISEVFDIPVPSLTLCAFPIQDVSTVNMTLVDFLISAEPLTSSHLEGSHYLEMSGNAHTNYFKHPEKLTMLPFQMNTSVAVLNGSLTKCVTLTPPNKWLGSKEAVVS